MSEIIRMAPLTMSSREIAELVEARHNDVVATIERLFSKGLLRSSRKTRKEATGGRPVEVYDLIARDTHLVVAGYSDEHRARVIDRWIELETAQRTVAIDRTRSRHIAASAYKLMSTVLKDSREAVGKMVAPHHFMIEAKLVNWAVSGEFKGLDRDSLTLHQLDLLGELEVKNAALILQGMKYEERKRTLSAFVQAWKAAHPECQLLEVA